MRWDNEAMFSGFLTGLVIGGVVAVFRGPRFNVKRVSQRLANNASESMREMMHDPVVESIEEGKEAARKRRSELGLAAVDNP